MEKQSSHTKLFGRVFIALCVLTALSLAIAQIDLPDNRWIIWSGMISISACKAFLVIAFFMHLKWEQSWKWALTIPALIMGITLTLSLVPDIGRRGEHQDGKLPTSLTDQQSSDQSLN